MRLRVLRGLLLLFILLLAAAVAWSIWSRRPRRARSAPAAPASAEGEAAQSIGKFSFTSTLFGKRAYSIVAERLTGTSEGVNTLEGIRSLEIVRSDGSVLRARADHGTIQRGEKDAGKGAVVLEGRVRVDGADGEWLESERVEYDQASGWIHSPGPTRFAVVPRATDDRSSSPAAAPAGGGSTVRAKAEESVPSSKDRPEEPRGASAIAGESGRLDYQLDGRTIQLSEGSTLRLVVPGQTDTVLGSREATVRVDGAVADLAGSVSLSRGEDVLESPVMHVVRSEGTGVTRLVAEPRARARIAPAPPAVAGSGTHPAPSLPQASSGSPPPPPRPATLEADRIEVTEAPGGPRSVLLSGHAAIQEDPAPGSVARSLAAREIAIREEGPGLRRALHAEGDVHAVLPPAPGETAARTLDCQRLDAVSEPGSGELTSADAEGDVRIVFGPRTASAARARFVGRARVELRGGRPRVEAPDRSLVADEVDLRTASQEVAGRGSVRTRFVPGSSAEGGPFAPGEPVEIASDGAVLRQSPPSAEFTGTVHARQSERALAANALSLNDAEQTARGEGSVSLRTFRVEAKEPVGAASSTGSSSASSTGTVRSTSPAPTGPVKIPVQIDADTLFHDGRTGTTRFEGHAIYREPGRKLVADRITTVGPGQKTPAETLAEGHVVFEGEGKRGTADVAHHRGSERTLTLEGRTLPVEVVETATGRTWRGPSLTWLLTADSIPFVTGESGRSRITGTPPRRDEVGQPTDRRRPR